MLSGYYKLLDVMRQHPSYLQAIAKISELTSNNIEVTPAILNALELRVQAAVEADLINYALECLAVARAVAEDE